MIRRYERSPQDGYWPSLTLVIHTETTPDEYSNLRYGVYAMEWIDPLTNEIEQLERGFFLGEGLARAERNLIKSIVSLTICHACLGEPGWKISSSPLGTGVGE